ncbi:MAG: hypothetical protein AAF655_19735 [Bacteroidota bacterium]
MRIKRILIPIYAAIIGAIISGTFLMVSTYLKNNENSSLGQEIDVRDSDNVIIGDNNTINNSSEEPTFTRLKNKDLVGEWRVTETRTNFLVRCFVESEITLLPGSKFLSKSFFKLEGSPYFQMTYHGDWVVENGTIIYDNITIDSLSLENGLGGINNYSATEIAKQYLNMNTENFKLEVFTLYSSNRFQTSYSWNNDNPVKTYTKRAKSNNQGNLKI